MNKRNKDRYSYVRTITDVYGKYETHQLLRVDTYYMRIDYENILSYALSHSMTVL